VDQLANAEIVEAASRRFMPPDDCQSVRTNAARRRVYINSPPMARRPRFFGNSTFRGPTRALGRLDLASLTKLPTFTAFAAGFRKSGPLLTNSPTTPDATVLENHDFVDQLLGYENSARRTADAANAAIRQTTNENGSKSRIDV
jgi:hypothetical protein